MELLDQIEAYLARTGMRASTFGRAAVADPRFVQDLREGRQPRQQTRRRINDFISDDR
jgi:2,4-dienoyl-CoA reductase-like NADH-dependent reductase (Old Yellow Enzyme family)